MENAGKRIAKTVTAKKGARERETVRKEVGKWKMIKTIIVEMNEDRGGKKQERSKKSRMETNVRSLEMQHPAR